MRLQYRLKGTKNGGWLSSMPHWTRTPPFYPATPHTANKSAPIASLRLPERSRQFSSSRASSIFFRLPPGLEVSSTNFASAMWQQVRLQAHDLGIPPVVLVLHLSEVHYE